MYGGQQIKKNKSQGKRASKDIVGRKE